MKKGLWIFFCLLFVCCFSLSLADSLPAITVQPASVSVSCYSSFSLTTEASGGSLSYRWQYRTEDGDWADWRNMETASVSAVALPEMNDWEIRCVVSNGAGSAVTDSVTVSALPILSRYNWPSDLSGLRAGEVYSLQVNGYGRDIRFQWYLSPDGRTWEKWEGQTGNVCEFTAVPAYSGKYVDCQVTDRYGHTAALSDRNAYLPRITVNGEIACEEERTLYYLDDTWVPCLGSVPAGLPRQLDFSGQDVKLLEGQNVTVSGGTVAPKGTVWYWYNGMASTWSRGVEGEVARTEYEAGDSVIQASGKNIRIHVVNYAEYYADSVMDEYLRENISSGMTDSQKAEKICRFIADRDYGTGSSWLSLVITGQGDCWASTDAVLHMAEKLGIRAMKNDERGKNGAGSGHMNAVALLDGQYCVVEAGYTGTAPRTWTIVQYGDPYDVNVISATQAGINSFMNFDGEAEIVIPSELDGRSITRIDYRAFVGHGELTSVTIPEGVTEIRSQAFYNCAGLTSVTIPASVTSLASDAFYGCESLTEILVAEGNPAYRSVGGVVFSASGTTLVAFPGGRTGTYTVPANVTAIDEFAFSNAKLDCVILPENMETISQYAFSSSAIRSFVLPANLKRIEEGAFYRASASAYILPQGVEYIGMAAFCQNSFVRITLPASVTEIGNAAFQSCSSSLVAFAPGCDPVIGESAFQKTTVGVLEGSGPWQYAKENNVAFQLLNGSGRIPLQSSWFTLSSPTVTCTGRPIDFSGCLTVDSSVPLRNNCDYRITASEYIRPGSVKLTVTGIGSYTGSLELDCTIRFYDMNGDGVMDSKDLIRYYHGWDTIDRTCILPEGTRVIESEAFAGTSFLAVILPRNVETVPEDAFRNSEVRVVILPDESWIPWATENGWEYRIRID